MPPLEEMLSVLHDPQARHAALVHAPIVLSLLAPLAAGLSALRRAENRALRGLTVACFAALLLSAWSATWSGAAALAEIGEAPVQARRVAQTHANMASRVWVFAVVGLLLAAGAWLPRRALARVAAVMATIVGGMLAGWVGITAHHGGTLVYAFGIGTPRPLAPADSDRGSPASTTQPADLLSDPRVEFFSREVRPLLSQKCMGCHGPTEFAESGLSLTSAGGMLVGGSRGPAVVPGRPSESLLIRALAGDGLPRMPYGGDPLTPEQLDALRRWVQEGAVWDR
ncbi:hypothetical protein B7486_02105 [cyanobacterium TDX16]|nr:hypothetical protein B7486_02105 [cyanobacterium TDX16]